MTIDYVVPMVFPQDLKWRHEYITANGMWLDDKQLISNTRYRTWGTEELLIRCIRKNLPWIRTIHIILARPSQAEYLNGLNGTNGQYGPSVRFVFHKDFMPEDKLPTFNSRAIEMYLHRIPDLAPYFLYGNDDMFPLSPMCEADFFRSVEEPQHTEKVLPCLHWKIKSFNAEKSFHRACMNGMNFVAAEFGEHYDLGWIHVGHNVVPMLRSTCEMFWSRWFKKMEASVTRFRQVQNYNQYIYSWWQILSGQYIDYEPKRGYVSIGNTEEEIIKAIRTNEGLLCINDNDAVNDITSLSAIVRNEIRKRLWEQH